MAEKDFREKRFEDFDDIFSDIINGLLFHGVDVVDEGDLESGMARSAHIPDGRFAEQERDVKKLWKSREIRLAVFGLENQSVEDPDFIFRNIGYDGEEYRDQVRRRNEVRRKNARLRLEGSTERIPLPDFYPVTTLILYFGDTRWRGSLNLKDHLNIPEGLDPYISDYRVNLFEIAFLSEEQLKMFKSDFRFVAEYFVASRMRKEGCDCASHFSVSLNQLKHVDEFIELMNAVTNSDRFSVLPELIDEHGGDSMMTILFDEAEARGEAIGETRGKAIGEAKVKQDVSSVGPLLKQNKSVSEIAAATGLSVEKVAEYRDLLSFML